MTNGTNGHQCAACGKWHYDVLCPACGSVVILESK